MGTGGNSEKVNRNEPIDARCIVEFRPNGQWKGEYGFDWFRIGDCAENGNKSDYIKDGVVGTYTNRQGQRYEGENTTDPDMKAFDKNNRRRFGSVYSFEGEERIENGYVISSLMERLNKNDGKFYKIKRIQGFEKDGRKYVIQYAINGGLIVKTYYIPYVIPWINLFDSDCGRCKYLSECKEKSEINECPKTANVRMIIKDDSTNLNQVLKIRIESNGRTINEIDRPFSKQYIIPISYLESDPRRQNTIKAYAYYEDKTHSLAGQLNVVNYFPVEVDVLFVSVNTRINEVCSSPSTNTNNYLNTQKNNLRRYLSQFMIVPKYKDQDRNGNNQNFFICPNLESFRNKNGDGLDYYGDNNVELLDTLLACFKKRYGDKYSKAYKIFFINQVGHAKGEEIGGKSSGIGNPKKSAVVFANSSASTVCHELLHCLGLYHSFSNENVNTKRREINFTQGVGITYKKCCTSNIMDYSKDKCTGETNPFERNSSWKWQWEKARNTIINRPYEEKIINALS